MKRALLITAGAALGGVAFLIIAIVVIWLLVSPTLPNLRDIIIVGAGFLILLWAFLMVAVAVGLLLLVIAAQQQAPRLFEKLNSVMESAQGSSDFVTERVVSPFIKISAAAAGARAGVRTLFGGGRKDVVAQRGTNANREET